MRHLRGLSTFSSVFLAVLVLASGQALAQLHVGDNLNLTLVHDSVTRLYDVHVPPSYDGRTPLPLVVDLHGLLSNKTEQRTRFSGFSALADQEGFIVAFPQGLFGQPDDPEAPNGDLFRDPLNVKGPSWNAGNLCCGQAMRENVDDVGFIKAMVSAIMAEVNVDPQRVYATGLSNGGALTQRLACEAADVFAAFAPFAFPIPFDPLEICRPSRPVPIITFQGDTDLMIPYEGGHLMDHPLAPVIPGARESFNYWRDVNGCEGEEPDRIARLGPTTTVETYTACDGGVKVGLATVRGIPDVPYMGHVLYFNVDGIDLAQVAWEFLSEFEKPIEEPQQAFLLPLWGLLAASWAVGAVRRRARGAPAARGFGPP